MTTDPQSRESPPPGAPHGGSEPRESRSGGEVSADADAEALAGASISRLFRILISPSASLPEVAASILDEARRLTESPHGFVSSIDPSTGDERWHAYTAIPGAPPSRKEGEAAEVTLRRDPGGRYPEPWGRALNSLAPCYLVNPASAGASHAGALSRAQGDHRGPASLSSLISVPVQLGTEILGQIAVADSARGYSRRDRDVLGRLAEAYALAIFRIRTDQNLAQERNFISAILSTLGALVVVLDREGRIVRFNRACELATGYLFTEVKGRCLWEGILVPEEAPGVQAVFSQLRSGQFPNQHENYWVGKDGTKRLIAWSNTAIVDEKGSVEFVIGTGIDVSELRQAEESLRALNEDLERKVTERTAIAEQRTAQLQALARELTEAEQRERRRLAQVLHDQLQQLLVGARFRASVLHGRLRGREATDTLQELDGLLSQAIEASRSLTIDLSPPALYEEGLCGGLRWLARAMEEEHGLRVEVEADADPAPADGTLSAFLFGAVRELLFNVVKHAGTERARVRLARSGSDALEVMVEDEGVGMAPVEGGSGAAEARFGLFSIRERLELLGGRLEVESTVGRGTRVRIWTPLKEGEGKAASP